jgi:hypothetical protein
MCEHKMSGCTAGKFTPRSVIVVQEIHRLHTQWYILKVQCSFAVFRIAMMGHYKKNVIRRRQEPNEGFRSIVNQKNSYGCEQESQDLI